MPTAVVEKQQKSSKPEQGKKDKQLFQSHQSAYLLNLELIEEISTLP